MKINKKYLIILFLVLILIILSLVGLLGIKNSYNKPYSYEWIKEKNSVINQQRLYVNNKGGKHIEGYVRITYLNGNSRKEKITKEGKIFVKSVIKKVRIINRR